MKTDLFKDLVWNSLAKAVIARALASLPAWLGGGPLGWALAQILTWASEWFYAAVKEVVELQLIVLKNEVHMREYGSAAAQLKLIAAGKGIESQEFKDAREKHKAALSQFVRLA